MSDIITVGNIDLLTTETAAVINSRQSAYPVGNDVWVKQTLRAVEYIAGRGVTVISSVGMHTWELVLACAASIRIPTIVVSPDTSVTIDAITGQFGIASEKLCLVLPQYKTTKKKKRLAERDVAVCRRADLLIPVSVRPGGNFDLILKKSDDRVFDRYRITYTKPNRRRPDYSNREPSHEIENDRWLIHFTRSSRGPWPGETRLDFYKSILHSAENYSHSAEAGLRHILKDGLIQGSEQNIRSGDRVVAFTLYNRGAASHLFRYRPRLANPNFEPYGIAIAKSLAELIGLYPVLYGNDELYDGLSESKRPLFQAAGREEQWMQEREWRAIGDVRLDRLTSEYTRVVVASDKEREAFEAISPFPIVTVFG